MGHIAPVNSVDFASGNSDYLVTSGRDRAVKIWQWRSKTVKLNIDLRKCGRGTGLLKQYLNQTSQGRWNRPDLPDLGLASIFQTKKVAATVVTILKTLLLTIGLAWQKSIPASLLADEQFKFS